MATVTHILAVGTTVEGQIRGEGDLTVAGVVRGGVALRGTLTISEGGSVSGDVHCQHLQLGGLLQGEIHVEGRTTIRQGATLQGSLVTGRLDVQGGARIQATVETVGSADTLPPPATPTRSVPPGPGSAGPTLSEDDGADAGMTNDDVAELSSADDADPDASPTSEWSVGTAATHADDDGERSPADDAEEQGEPSDDEADETEGEVAQLGDDPGTGVESDAPAADADSDDPR